MTAEKESRADEWLSAPKNAIHAVQRSNQHTTTGLPARFVERTTVWRLNCLLLHSSLSRSPFCQMSDEETYEVSHIVEEDYSNPNKRMFLVRWLGYTADYDSWEPLENLEDGAIEVVREWDRKRKQMQKRKAKEEKVTVAQSKVKRSASQSRDDTKEISGRVNITQMVIFIQFVVDDRLFVGVHPLRVLLQMDKCLPGSNIALRRF
jgi:Chromo (CHRromatin Organisation MOdifier) domain